ncbi:flippase [Canicola haemoglobinophilus]|uniref:Putative lipooligosaccharide flippase n=1 Tax=Canicola haemoglobinophilus TaxID=733 RepID=A0A1V4AZF8_9PAST|nr:oligosaccharide flippase family protein [Canicola haemoglobinophilus]OOR98513.1 flippase [Canicola haemoglobinophilus]STO60061.1 putative lipooligosaccharide flippase [Canicola haemoglobinophilus]
MVIKDSVIYLIGELLSKLVPFLLLPYLSHKLGSEGYGLLSYYQTYLALFVIIIGLSQEGAVARYFYFYGKRALNNIVNTGYIYTSFIGGVIIVICYILNSEILIYVAVSAIFQSFINVQLVIRQCYRNAISYVAIQLSLALSLGVFTVLFLEFSDSFLVKKYILALVSSYILVWIISYIIYSKQILKRKYICSRYKLYFKYLLTFGFPLIFHQTSLFLKGQLDRLFIYHQFNEFDLGLYSMGFQISFVFSVLVHSLSKATLPYFYEGLKIKNINIKRIQKWVIISLLFIPLPSFIVYFIPKEFFSWLLGPDFYNVKYYISLFLITNSLSVPYLLLVNYLFYYAQNKLISCTSIFSTIIYILVLVIVLQLNDIEYIPYSGIAGAIANILLLYFITARLGMEK